jgi:pyruvate-ferredoxin/flavodoxin oxidoreductase
VGEPKTDPSVLEESIRRDVASRFASRIMQLALGEPVQSANPATGLAQLLDTPTGESQIGATTAPNISAGPAVNAAVNAAGEHGSATDGYMAPWIETARCTSCDECIKINPKIFVYNEQKKAVIKDPQGGPYQDLVKAAERCTAQVIHPGLPKNRSEKGIEKWIARGEKRN